MKAQDRILEAARTLFNAEGASGLSALDIATALEMSPGHLYYHFKGRREIARALAARHEAHLIPVLASVHGEAAPTATLALIAAELEEYRFFYAEIFALGAGDPHLVGTFRRLRAGLRAAMARLAEEHVEAGLVKPISERLTQTLMFTSREERLINPDQTSEARQVAVVEACMTLLIAHAKPPTPKRGRPST